MACRNNIKDKVNGKSMVLHRWNSDDSTADHVRGESQTFLITSLPNTFLCRLRYVWRCDDAVLHTWNAAVCHVKELEHAWFKGVLGPD